MFTQRFSLPWGPDARGGADGITVAQAIGPFIKRQAAWVAPPPVAPGLRKMPSQLNEVPTSNKWGLLQDVSPATFV